MKSRETVISCCVDFFCKPLRKRRSISSSIQMHVHQRAAAVNHALIWTRTRTHPSSSCLPHQQQNDLARCCNSLSSLTWSSSCIRSLQSSEQDTGPAREGGMYAATPQHRQHPETGVWDPLSIRGKRRERTQLEPEEETRKKERWQTHTREDEVSDLKRGDRAGQWSTEPFHPD